MIAEAAVALGRRIAAAPTAGADDYWAGRLWDRERCETEPLLGPHYQAETTAMCELIRATVMRSAAVRRAVEVGCGVGVFSVELLAAGVDEVVVVDVSARALARTRDRVGHDPRLSVVHGDVRRYDPGDAGRFDVLVCVDALHHIGDPVDALDDMCRLVRPGGALIGNIWTADHFHEFQRLRRGTLRHAAASIGFCAAAFAGRFGWSSGAARTELIGFEDARHRLSERFDVLHLSRSRYWLRLVIRR